MTYARIPAWEIVTADARKVSPREFMDALGLSSPELRAKRDEQGRKFAAELEAKQRREILAMRERIAALLSPENAAKAREEWALQDSVAEDLRFTIELERKDKAA
jgi:hypothetical protein